MTGEKLSSVGSSSRRGGKGVRGMNGGIVILAFCEFHSIREHENMVDIQVMINPFLLFLEL